MGEFILKNVTFLDVQKKQFIKGNIYINNGKICSINGAMPSVKEIDMEGKYLVPGFIDGHIHLESSIISPEEFSKIVSLRGTSAVVIDPHEIANVKGIDGIKWMLNKTNNLPIEVYMMIPSCVPATPFDESAYTLTSDDINRCFDLDNNRILGLAEMMNYPGVIYRDPEVIKKIAIAKARKKLVDGHAPMLSGSDLKKYIAAGIMSDHECSTYEEAVEKLETARSLNQEYYIMIREGTAAKNLEKLSPLMMNKDYYDDCMFVTDDKHPEEVFNVGHIDNSIRKAIRLGVKPEVAYTVASYNAAKYFRLNNLGSIEVGKDASFVILDDVNTCSINQVYFKGEVLTEEKVRTWPKNTVSSELEESVRHAINMDIVTEDRLDSGVLPIIELVPGEIITKNGGFSDGYDLDNDIIKVVVIESHRNTNHIGIAYLKGMGLKEGAVGTTVAHDSHYMILAGTNDSDIAKAANELRNMQGGKIVVKNGEVLGKLGLPIANLMTDEDPKVVIKKMQHLKDSVKVNDGIDPFMNLSFVSLAVIGDIRLLPGGAFDVTKWNFIEKQLIKKR